jgi:hypothetical protein
VAKANYHQIRRQKELARKTRQEEKKQKRSAVKSSDPAAADSEGTPSIEAAVTDSTGSAGGQGQSGS